MWSGNEESDSLLHNPRKRHSVGHAGIVKRSHGSKRLEHSACPRSVTAGNERFLPLLSDTSKSPRWSRGKLMQRMGHAHSYQGRSHTSQTKAWRVVARAPHETYPCVHARRGQRGDADPRDHNRREETADGPITARNAAKRTPATVERTAMPRARHTVSQVEAHREKAWHRCLQTRHQALLPSRSRRTLCLHILPGRLRHVAAPSHKSLGAIARVVGCAIAHIKNTYYLTV